MISHFLIYIHRPPPPLLTVPWGFIATKRDCIKQNKLFNCFPPFYREFCMDTTTPHSDEGAEKSDLSVATTIESQGGDHEMEEENYTSYTKSAYVVSSMIESQGGDHKMEEESDASYTKSAHVRNDEEVSFEGFTNVLRGEKKPEYSVEETNRRKDIKRHKETFLVPHGNSFNIKENYFDEIPCVYLKGSGIPNVDNDVVFKLAFTEDRRILHDGRKWQEGTKSSMFLGMYCKKDCKASRSRLFHCFGNYICNSKICSFKKRYGVPNLLGVRLPRTGDMVGYKFCALCDQQMDRVNCRDKCSPYDMPPRKYVVKCRNCNYIAYLHLGQHSCKEKHDYINLDLEKVRKSFREDPKLTARNYILKQLETLLSTMKNPEEFWSQASAFADIDVLDKIRNEVHRETFDYGTDLEGVRSFVDGQTLHNLDERLCMIDEENDIFLTSKVKLKIAKDLCDAGEEYKYEGVSLDGNTSIVTGGYTVVGLSAYCVSLQKVVFLIMIITKKKESYICVLRMLTILNKYMNQEFQEDFMPACWISDSGGGLKKGLVMYGVKILHMEEKLFIQADELHQLKNIDRMAAFLGIYKHKAIKKILDIKNAVTVDRAMHHYQELTDLLNNIREEAKWKHKVTDKPIDMKKFLDGFAFFWRSRLAHFKCYQNMPDVNTTIESHWAKYAKHQELLYFIRTVLAESVREIMDDQSLERGEFALSRKCLTPKKRSAGKLSKLKKMGRDLAKELAATLSSSTQHRSGVPEELESEPEESIREAARDYNPTSTETSRIDRRRRDRAGPRRRVPSAGTAMSGVREKLMKKLVRTPIIITCIRRQVHKIEFVVLLGDKEYFIVAFRASVAIGRTCTCKAVQDGSLCIHLAFVLGNTMRFRMNDAPETFQVAFSDEEFETIKLKTPQIETSFSDRDPCYHVDKNGKGWNQAKCAHCNRKLPREGIRVWVFYKWFSYKEKMFIGQSRTKKFCPKRECFDGYVPGNGEVVPPFLTNTMLTQTRHNFTEAELDQFRRMNIVIEDEILQETSPISSMSR